MAMQQIEAFYRKVMEDEALKEKVMGIKGAPMSVAEQVVEIARENGFDVTVEDFKQYYYDQAEMSAEEMEQISAGKKKKGCPEYNDQCDKVCGEVCGTFLGHYIGNQR